MLTAPKPSLKQRLKRVLKLVPGLQPVSRFARRRYQALSLERKTAEEIFTEIHHENKWGGKDSASGTGSDLTQTQVIRNELPAIWQNFAIHTMLDIPCGDFHWMKHVELAGIDYIGGDIVADLTSRNQQYETSNIHFRQLNLLQDKLPKVDLVFCRDCLVHLSFKDAFVALHNICDSGSKYLLTTTFTQHQVNRDIATGQWRMLNLESAPFSLLPPLKIINEGCTEHEIEYRDKSLGLWRVEDIKGHLATLKL